MRFADKKRPRRRRDVFLAHKTLADENGRNAMRFQAQTILMREDAAFADDDPVRRDFRGEPFGPMPQLLSIAEVVDKLQAICVICGNPASRNQRLIAGRPARYDSPTIMVGSTESYEARCRSCHSVPRRDEDQVRLL